MGMDQDARKRLPGEPPEKGMIFVEWRKCYPLNDFIWFLAFRDEATHHPHYDGVGDWCDLTVEDLDLVEDMLDNHWKIVPGGSCTVNDCWVRGIPLGNKDIKAYYNLIILDYHADRTRQFIQDAREAIAEGYIVGYSSWS